MLRLIRTAAPDMKILKSSLLKIAVPLPGCQPSRYEGNQVHCSARDVRKCERVGLLSNLISAESR